MKIELGAKVRTSDGKDAGTIDRLVVDPAHNKIKSAVIHKGFLLTRDVEAPLDRMKLDADGSVRLSYSSAELDDLPEFYESSYLPTPPPGYMPPMGYPSVGLYWPVAYDYTLARQPLPAYGDRGTQEEVQRAWEREDLENAVIGEGSEIRARDGKKIGELHRLVFDTDTSRVTGFVVREGFIFTHDVQLPASLIASADDGVLFLSVNEDEVRERET